MVKILYEPNDACTCLTCRETKTIHKLRVEYKGGDGYEIAMCGDCINKFAQELYNEIENMEG